ncbi:MAG: WYL domain-containing protein [Clostridia bacterium]|nr:WYL domain-containing protein [Clostridia bacterium]
MINGKKALIMNILDILRKYSDAEHRLSQKQISDILEKEYYIKADRKTVKRNLSELCSMGYDIEFTEITRRVPVTDSQTGVVGYTENSIITDYYLNREFSDSELRLLIDGLLFSNHIPFANCKELTEKLEGLSSIYFKSKMRHISALPKTDHLNKQFLYTVDILAEAIEKYKQVVFNYCEYSSDKKLHRRRRPDGTLREYTVSPYQMASKEGKYYLICNYDKYNDISNYRIDRIANIRLLDTPAKPFEILDGAENEAFDLHKYMTEHIYMYSSGNVRASFDMPCAMISDVIDIFGTDVTFSGQKEDRITVSAFANEQSILQFAKSYAPDVIIISPDSLRHKLSEDIEKTLTIYRGME